MFSWFAKATTSTVASFVLPYILQAITNGLSNIGIDSKTTVVSVVSALLTGFATYLVPNTAKKA